jgi:hypothetical protein
MDDAWAAIDGNIEEQFAGLAVCGVHLGQMFDVDMDKTYVIILEALVSFTRLRRGIGRSWIELFGPDFLVDAVATEVWEEMPKR